MDRGTLGWTSPAHREGRDAAGGKKDSRDRGELPEVRRGTWTWAKVNKREDGSKGGLGGKGLMERVGRS